MNGKGVYIDKNGNQTPFENTSNPNEISNIKSPLQFRYGFEGEPSKIYTLTMLTKVIDPELGVNLTMESDDGNGNQKWNLFLPGKASDKQ